MEDTDRDVDYINMEVTPRVAVMSDGEILPVVSFLDDDGDTEDDENEATRVLAGPCKEGYFYYIHLAPAGELFN